MSRLRQQELSEMAKHRAIIETIINTTALALTSYGVITITQNNDWSGYIAIIFGICLEFIKYTGRHKQLW